MALPLALSALQKGAAVLVFTGVFAPLVGMLLKRVGGGWETMGGGPFSILNEPPPQRPGGGAQKVDPAIQAAEVRQMLEAKSERRRQRGEAPLDVEAELAELTRPRFDPALLAEIRQLVEARNRRRIRQGKEPLDVEAEVARQVRELGGGA
jgi:hypothetical protein